MNYIQVSISVNDEKVKEILIALLSDNNFEGFEETEEFLYAYIPQDDFEVSLLKEVLTEYELSFSITEIEKTNWNHEWESNFQPVIVGDFCTVRADFHNVTFHTKHEIIITPKMSFGTGHHATTQLMIDLMQDIDFKNKSVFDFGTGTGILAILANKLGAKNITAIDNDEWSVENAIENAVRNGTQKINISLNSIENISTSSFDIILANINRHILLNFMPQLFEKTNHDGLLLLSGLLTEDKEIIMESALKEGFKFKTYKEQNNWIALLFIKQ